MKFIYKRFTGKIRKNRNSIFVMCPPCVNVLYTENLDQRIQNGYAPAALPHLPPPILHTLPSPIFTLSTGNMLNLGLHGHSYK
jgi:hypothetical protein